MRDQLRMNNASDHTRGRWKKTFGELESKYRVFHIVKFSIASGIGFLIAETILALGIIVFYHTTKVPSVAYSSLNILGLNAVAFGIGVSAAFIINERVTVRGQGEEKRKGRANWVVRWCKYQLASLLGNVLIVAIQLVLLAAISLSPVIGNIVGGVVSFPITFILSMHFVWRVRPFGEKSEEMRSDNNR